MKASKAAGLKVRFGTVFLDQVGNIANAGEQAAGHFVAQTFNPEAAGAEGERFVASYKAKSGRVPVATEPQTAFGLEMVADALKRTKAEGGALNVNALARNLETTRLKTPMGEASMRASDHQVLLPLVVSMVSADSSPMFRKMRSGERRSIALRIADPSTISSVSTPAPCRIRDRKWRMLGSSSTTKHNGVRATASPTSGTVGRAGAACPL